GQSYKITNVTYLEQNGFDYDQALFTKLAQQGNSISYLIDEQQAVGIIAQGDQIKDSSQQMVTELLVRGITPVRLTGDNQPVEQEVAESLGSQYVHAQLMP
ncbi:heavy metal translocating P-type ATPase, partial [Staphylococcus pseudintermedius]